MTPASDIQPRQSSSMTRAYVATSQAEPAERLGDERAEEARARACARRARADRHRRARAPRRRDEPRRPRTRVRRDDHRMVHRTNRYYNKARMSLDDLALRPAALRSIVWCAGCVCGGRPRARSPPAADRADRRARRARCSRSAIAKGRVPFLARLVAPARIPDGADERRAADLDAGLPDGGHVRRAGPIFPAFTIHDKRRRTDIYFPRGGDAAHVEQTSGGRPARHRAPTAPPTAACSRAAPANNLLTFAMLKRPTGAGLLCTVSTAVVLAWVVLKGSVVSVIEPQPRHLTDGRRSPSVLPTEGWKWLADAEDRRLGMAARALHAGGRARPLRRRRHDLRELRRLRRRSRTRGARVTGARCGRSVAWMPRSTGCGGSFARVPEYRYDLHVLSDHGQATCRPYRRVHRRAADRAGALR